MMNISLNTQLELKDKKNKKEKTCQLPLMMKFLKDNVLQWQTLSHRE